MWLVTFLPKIPYNPNKCAIWIIKVIRKRGDMSHVPPCPQKIFAYRDSIWNMINEGLRWILRFFTVGLQGRLRTSLCGGANWASLQLTWSTPCRPLLGTRSSRFLRSSESELLYRSFFPVPLASEPRLFCGGPWPRAQHPKNTTYLGLKYCRGPLSSCLVSSLGLVIMSSNNDK